jgi:hypothetical protein
MTSLINFWNYLVRPAPSFRLNHNVPPQLEERRETWKPVTRRVACIFGPVILHAALLPLALRYFPATRLQLAIRITAVGSIIWSLVASLANLVYQRDHTQTVASYCLTYNRIMRPSGPVDIGGSRDQMILDFPKDPPHDKDEPTDVGIFGAPLDLRPGNAVVVAGFLAPVAPQAPPGACPIPRTGIQVNVGGRLAGVSDPIATGRSIPIKRVISGVRGGNLPSRLARWLLCNFQSELNPAGVMRNTVVNQGVARAYFHRMVQTVTGFDQGQSRDAIADCMAFAFVASPSALRNATNLYCAQLAKFVDAEGQMLPSPLLE